MKKQIKKVSVRNTKSGKKSSGKTSEFIKIIKEDLETPIATLHFSAIARPVYFPGCQIPRYKISLLLDENRKEHKKYLKSLEKIAKENDVPTLGRKTKDGLIQMTYQGKEFPKVYLVENDKKPVRVELEHDMPKGIECKVTFDLKRYYDKFQEKNAFNFSPQKVTFYLDDETQEIVEVDIGDSKDSRD